MNMKYVNKFILVGYLITGAGTLVWLFFHIKYPPFLAIFFNVIVVYMFWFVSLLFGFIKTAFTLSRHDKEYWNSLYPVNFGISILATVLLSLFAEPFDRKDIYLLGVIIVAGAVSILLIKSGWINYKFLPGALLALLILLLLSGIAGLSLHGYGTAILLFLGSIFFLVPTFKIIKNKLDLLS